MSRGRRTRPRAPEVPGVTYRQLDYWAKRGFLRPGRENPDKPSGTGNFRDWPAEELRVAEDIGRLRRAGLALPAAERKARQGREAVEAFLALTGAGAS